MYRNFAILFVILVPFFLAVRSVLDDTFLAQLEARFRSSPKNFVVRRRKSFQQRRRCYTRRVIIFARLQMDGAKLHDILKCYMCTSVTDKDCGNDIIKSKTIEPTECTMEEMTKWQNTIQQNKLLTPIFSIFAVDNPRHDQSMLKNMACAKVDTKIQGQDKIVTIRSCQTAQALNVDPCTSIEGKLYGGMEYCGLCEENGCNDSITISPSISNIIFTVLGTFAFALIFYRDA